MVNYREPASPWQKPAFRDVLGYTVTASFEDSYPNIAHFVDTIGRIEIGYDPDSPLTSFVRAIDPGGMIWEGQAKYKTISDALQDLDKSLGDWLIDEGVK